MVQTEINSWSSSLSLILNFNLEGSTVFKIKVISKLVRIIIELYKKIACYSHRKEVVVDVT